MPSLAEEDLVRVQIRDTVQKICRLHRLVDRLVPPFLAGSDPIGAETWIEIQRQGIHQEQPSEYLHLATQAVQRCGRTTFDCRVSREEGSIRLTQACVIEADCEGLAIEVRFFSVVRTPSVFDHTHLVETQSAEIRVVAVLNSTDLMTDHRSTNPEICLAHAIDTFLAFLENLPKDCFQKQEDAR